MLSYSEGASPLQCSWSIWLTGRPQCGSDEPWYYMGVGPPWQKWNAKKTLKQPFLHCSRSWELRAQLLSRFVQLCYLLCDSPTVIRIGRIINTLLYQGLKQGKHSNLNECVQKCEMLRTGRKAAPKGQQFNVGDRWAHRFSYYQRERNVHVSHPRVMNFRMARNVYSIINKRLHSMVKSSVRHTTKHASSQIGSLGIAARTNFIKASYYCFSQYLQPCEGMQMHIKPPLFAEGRLCAFPWEHWLAGRWRISLELRVATEWEAASELLGNSLQEDAILWEFSSTDFEQSRCFVP